MSGDHDITPRLFVEAFTDQAISDGEPISQENLLKRLDIMLGALKEERTAKTATRVLQGALIRFCQAYGDQEITNKVNAILDITMAILGA